MLDSRRTCCICSQQIKEWVLDTITIYVISLANSTPLLKSAVQAKQMKYLCDAAIKRILTLLKNILVVYKGRFWRIFENSLRQHFSKVGPHRRIPQKNHSDFIPIFSPKVVQLQNAKRQRPNS